MFNISEERKEIFGIHITSINKYSTVFFFPPKMKLKYYAEKENKTDKLLLLMKTKKHGITPEFVNQYKLLKKNELSFEQL